MNILFIGCGIDQLPAFKYALELGLEVFGVDGRAEAEGKQFCKAFEQVDIMNPDAVEEVALRLNKKYGIDGCIAPAVEAGISVGRAVDRLGLLGIGEKTATILTDKILRRVAFDEAGIPQPRWGYREEKKSGEWNIWPAVVKPRNRSAAQGVRLVKNMGEVGLNYDYLEQYLEGWEISTECLVFHDQSLLVISADRNYDKKLKYAPYLLEDGCSLPSKLPDMMQKKIFQIVRKIVLYFGLRSCTIKLDLLVKDNVVYVIECAPRLGGGKLSSIMIPLSTGVHWWKHAIQLAMGVSGFDYGSPKKKPVAQRYVFPEHPTSHKDRLKSFETTGATVEEAIKKAEDLVRAYHP